MNQVLRLYKNTKDVEFNPTYTITYNPERTKLTVPYTLSALQKAGEKLVKTTQTAADTTQTSTQGAKDTTQSTTQRDADTTQTSEGTTQSLTEMQNAILSILREEPTLGRKDIAQKIEGITEDGVKYHLQKLQKLGILRREGGDYGGHWVILR